MVVLVFGGALHTQGTNAIQQQQHWNRTHQMNDGNRRKRRKIRRRFSFYVYWQRKRQKKKIELRNFVNYAMCALDQYIGNQGQTTQYYSHLPFRWFLFFLSPIVRRLHCCTIFVRLNRWMDSHILSVGDESTIVLVILLALFLSHCVFVYGSFVHTNAVFTRTYDAHGTHWLGAAKKKEYSVAFMSVVLGNGRVVRR